MAVGKSGSPDRSEYPKFFSSIADNGYNGFFAFAIMGREILLVGVLLFITVILLFSAPTEVQPGPSYIVAPSQSSVDHNLFSR